MKKSKLFISLIVCIFTMGIICSCDANKQEATNVAMEFMHALQRKDSTIMRQYFPEVDSLSTLSKSDSIVITKVEKQESGKYYVMINNIYEDEEFEQATKTITLIVEQAKLEGTQPKFIITNSIGLADFTSHPLYKFANLVGCFDPYFPETDIETYKRIEDVRNLYFNYWYNISRNIRDNIKLSDYVDIGQTPGFVEVTALIVNNSDFDVKNIKYKLDFWSRDYQSQKEEGHIFPEGIRSGSSKAATIKTGYIGLKSIKLFFDIEVEYEEILKCIYDLPFKGNEYRKYLRDKNE